MFGFSNKLKFAPSDNGDIVYISMKFFAVCKFHTDSGGINSFNHYSVCTDLEKSLKMTLVMENSWISTKMKFVLELSLNFEKIFLIIIKIP